MVDANARKREQIARQIKLHKITEIHKYFDEDKDGYLNYAELSRLQSQTSSTEENPLSDDNNKGAGRGSKMSRNQYKSICTALGCKPQNGLDLRAIILTYESAGKADVEKDYDTVFAINRKSTAAKKEKNAPDDPSTHSKEQKQTSLSPTAPEKRNKAKVGKTTSQKKNATNNLRESFTRPTNMQNEIPKPPQSEHLPMPVPSPAPAPLNISNVISLLKRGDDPTILRDNAEAIVLPKIMDFIEKQEPISIPPIFDDEPSVSKTKPKTQTRSMEWPESISIAVEDETIPAQFKNSHLDLHEKKRVEEDECNCACALM
jgi:hypothetical protein